MRLISQTGMLLALVMGCGVLFAQTGLEAGKTGPKEAVQHATNEVISMLRTQGEELRKGPDKIYRLVHDYILPHFDFDKMSHFVLGNVWKDAAEQQKADFQREFKHLLVTTYTSALAEYSTDGEIVYSKVMRSAKNENIAIVPTEIHQKGSAPVKVAYRMYRTDGVWRIYDVGISGISLLTNYRASFSSQVRNEGLDGLISSMSKHNKTQAEDDSATVNKALRSEK